MAIDFSGMGSAAPATNSAPAAQAGGMSLNLSKGMTLDLTKRNPGLKKIKAGLGWDVAVAGSADFDLDVAALLCRNGRLVSGNDVVFFNNMNQPGVSLLGDNRTGAGEGDDEVITVDLSSIDPGVNRIVFVVTIFEAMQRRQTFGMIGGSFIRLCDMENNDRELCRFELKDNFSTETAVIFAELVKNGSDWDFKTIGDGKQGDLNAIASMFM